MLRIGAAAAGLVLAFAGQQQPPIRVGTELVRVDVSVLDGNGRPVTSLTADDFVVMEDGVPQKIQLFRLLELNGAPADGDDLTLTIAPRSGREHELAREDVRLFVIFWDEFHIAPDPVGRLLREDLLRFVRDGFAPTDLVAIMDPWTPASDLVFTRDRYRLATDLSQRRGRSGVYVPPRNGAEENHLQLREGPEFARAQVAVSALRATAMHLGTVRESRKVILYVSHEFGLPRGSQTTMQEVIEAANDANVAVYSINPQGLNVRGSNFRNGMLASIAHNTGGESFLSNSPAMAARRAVSQSAVSYLLGYAPSPLRQDGKFHEIKVRVKGNHQVRARSGYWAPDAASKDRARAAAAEATLPPPIDAAFAQLARLGRLDEEGQPRIVQTIFDPEQPSAAVAVLPPVLRRVQRPGELQAALTGAAAAHDGREFSRAERIIARIPLTGEHAAGATLSIALIDRRGKHLTALPFTRTPDGATLDLPLQSIARGDYLLAIEARHDTTRAAAYVPIRIAER
jgi:VWFA-related protein